MSPVLAGFLGAGVLVLLVMVLVLLWWFCQRRLLSGRYKLHGDRYCDTEDPPYKFIHMLKGISIYPESLSGSKKIVRGVRRVDRCDAAPPVCETCSILIFIDLYSTFRTTSVDQRAAQYHNVKYHNGRTIIKQ